MQVILSASDCLEFEEALKAKSCQTVNSFRQLVAMLSPLFVIDYRGLYDLASEEPLQHWTLQGFTQLT